MRRSRTSSRVNSLGRSESSLTGYLGVNLLQEKTRNAVTQRRNTRLTLSPNLYMNIAGAINSSCIAGTDALHLRKIAAAPRTHKTCITHTHIQQLANIKIY